MFIHLGGSQTIRLREIIAILEAEGQDLSVHDSFIAAADREGWIERITEDEIKSYVVTDFKIYASPISSITLKKRAGFQHQNLKVGDVDASSGCQL
ncbi:protein of unknown function [Seinonella peptonophila]|uniref:DUF370 domain-containing protein n=1 Tax=Seinonella peptonophila TaxID=112248 RepID=A0A1M4WZM8_9BACL|nr:extracellular matrix/biofilm biosynthesis regulator RemA family protein [Seinonella peptonophila]SHE86655.1 protein of unknown function [Seinonella peptonophila]